MSTTVTGTAKTTETVRPATPACNRATGITKSLLGYGVIAGPFYVVLSVTQALSHDGFDLSRNAWSQLSAGPLGWIQMANLVLTGTMVIAGAVGLSRTLPSRVAPLLLGLFGAGMVLAGFNPADPGYGYPVGVPAPATPSGHAVVHLASASVGFLCAVAAMVVLGRAFAQQNRRGLARSSRIVGIAFLAAFGALATGSGGPVLVITFTATVIALFAMIAVISVRQYRRVGQPT